MTIIRNTLNIVSLAGSTLILVYSIWAWSQAAGM